MLEGWIQLLILENRRISKNLVRLRLAQVLVYRLRDLMVVLLELLIKFSIELLLLLLNIHDLLVFPSYSILSNRLLLLLICYDSFINFCQVTWYKLRTILVAMIILLSHLLG